MIYKNGVYCSGCDTSISVEADHIDELPSSSCLLRALNIAYAVGNLHTHHSHNITLYGGVYLCRAYGAAGSNKLIKPSRPCQSPTRHGERNLKAYQKGTKPVGFLEWLYERVHLKENVIMTNYIEHTHINTNTLPQSLLFRKK